MNPLVFIIIFIFFFSYIYKNIFFLIENSILLFCGAVKVYLYLIEENALIGQVSLFSSLSPFSFFLSDSFSLSFFLSFFLSFSPFLSFPQKSFKHLFEREKIVKALKDLYW